MKILAIDPGTKCGWAHSDGPSGVWDLSVRPDESSGMRLIRLRSKLDEMRGVVMVAFEATRTAKHFAAIRVAAMLQGTIETWCIDSTVEYRGYSPSEIKRHATGKGNANKDAMLAAAKAKWNGTVEIIDDNHADALWLLDLARKEYGE